MSIDAAATTPSALVEFAERPVDPAGARERLEEAWETPKTLWGKLATVDHKEIGVRYLVTAFVFLGLGGLEAVLIRVQLWGPDLRVIAAEAYNQAFSMHGITMIFWYASPILSGFSNYFIPLVIGARDMAFPRLNALSYWIFLFSGIFLYASVPLGAVPDAGWFAYAPLTEPRFSPGLNQDFYALALLFLTVSTTVGAINFIVTILRLRAPGMAVHRMPLLTYSTMTMSVLSVVALPALTAACGCLELDRRLGTHFFEVTRGGSPMLWQQMFWFFGHPWVYIIFLPATGMISMLLPVFARRPIVGYPFVAISTVATGIVGMGVWVHHMFATGMSGMAMSFFAAASMTISVFSTVQVLAWTATLWRGRPVRSTSLSFAVGAIATFVVGGLSGVLTAVIPFDWQITDTYFVVAHLHYVLIGANVFPVFAALYYWFPKITGRRLDERLGQASFWTMFVGFNGGFFPMHLSGLLGMRRRIYTYAPGDGLGTLNALTTIGALILGVGILITVVNVLRSRRGGALAGSNPWNADTLEWSTDSPTPAYAFVHLPLVGSRHPLWDERSPAPDAGPILDRGGRMTLATRGADADLVAIAKMPEDSLAPVTLALALAAGFTALLLGSLKLAAAAALACLAVVAAWLWPERSPRHSSRPPRVGDLELGWDDRRGTWGMALFIASEASLFVVLFFGYFYLGHVDAPWPPEPPKVTIAAVMLAVLLTSSAVLHAAERALSAGRHRLARGALGATIVLGAGFVALQALEYRDRLRALRPDTNAYGSIFYAITGLHGLHVLLGLAMLIFVMALPRLEPSADSPHRPLHNAALYWHFVDALWVAIVAILYVLPRIR